MLDITDKKYFSNQITDRFFLAMDGIIGNRKNGKVTAKAFGDVVGISSSNLIRIRQNPEENFVTIEAVGRLCNHYKISAAWLISGIGNRYSDDELFAAYQTLDKRLGDVETIVSDLQQALEILRKSTKK